MKILLTVRTFKPPFTGGVDVYADRIGRSFRRLGHRTAFLALDSSRDHPDVEVSQEVFDGQPVWRLNFNLSARPRAALDQAYDPEMGAAFSKVLLEEKPDLLIILNYYLLSLSAVEQARALDIPIVHIATDFVPICRRATLIRGDGSVCRDGESIKSCAACFVSQRLAGRVTAGVFNRLLPTEILNRIAADRDNLHPANPLSIFKPYWVQAGITAERIRTIDPLRRAHDLVVTPTRFTQEMFSRHGFDPARVRLLPFAVEPDNALVGLKKKPSSGLRFVFIGRLQPYKGVHVLIEAFNQLSDPGKARLIIYGKQDDYEDYYRSLMDAVERNGHLEFRGSIAPDRLHEAFADSDYFILPSIWHENTPLILLDALQSGTPVIASNIGGVRDSVRDWENGFLFPMGDAGALAEVLQRCIDRPELLDTLRPGDPVCVRRGQKTPR